MLRVACALGLLVGCASGELLEDGDGGAGSDARRDGSSMPCTGGTRTHLDPASGHCYILTSSSQPWQAAQMSCAALGNGVHLATISSAAENQIVLDLAQMDVWIGASDTQTEGTWVWVTGERVASGYASWAMGQPDAAQSNQDCAYLDSPTGGWSDVSCTSDRRFVCERD